MKNRFQPLRGVLRYRGKWEGIEKKKKCKKCQRMNIVFTLKSSAVIAFVIYVTP